MKKEKSCGAVIYKKENNEIYFLILQHNGGHYAFSKGHVEGNETEKETALREIKEETNLDVIIDDSFRETDNYSPFEGVNKDVIYFLATPISNEIIAQKSEIRNISWLTYEEAEKIITYKRAREILKKAYDKLK